MKRIVLIIIVLVEIVCFNVSNAQKKNLILASKPWIATSPTGLIENAQGSIEIDVRKNNNLYAFFSREFVAPNIFIMDNPQDNSKYLLFAKKTRKRTDDSRGEYYTGIDEWYKMEPFSNLAQSISKCYGGPGICKDDYTYEIAGKEDCGWALRIDRSVEMKNGDVAILCTLIINNTYTTGYYTLPGQTVTVMGQKMVVGGGTYANRKTSQERHRAIIITTKQGEIKKTVPVPIEINNSESDLAMYASPQGGVWVAVLDLRGYNGHLLIQGHKKYLDISGFPLIKYDEKGAIVFYYVPDNNDEYYDIEEMNNTVILVGKTQDRGYVGYNNPAMLIIDVETKKVLIDYYAEKRDMLWGGVKYSNGKFIFKTSFDSWNSAEYSNGLWRRGLDSLHISQLGLRSYFHEKKYLQSINGVVVPYEEDGKYGFASMPPEYIIITPSVFDAYRADSALKEGVIVKKGDRWGVINNRGDELLSCKYENVLVQPVVTSEKPLLLIQQDSKWGCLTLSGKEVLPVEYDSIRCGELSTNMLLKKKGKWGVCSLSGNSLVECEYDEIDEDAILQGIPARICKDGKWGIISDQYSVACDYDCLERMMKQVFLARRGDKIGLISAGEEKIPCEFEEAYYYDEHPYYEDSDSPSRVVRNMKGDDMDFVINNSKQLSEYEARRKSLKPMIMMKKNDKIGVYNVKGDELLACEYDFVSKDVLIGLPASIRMGGEWGVFDAMKNSLLHCKYDKLFSWGQSSFFTYKDGCIGLVHDSEETIPNEYDAVFFIDELSWDGNLEPFLCKLDRKEEYLDPGYTMHFPDDWEDSSKKTIILEKKGKYGLSSVKGNIILECEYDSIGYEILLGKTAYISKGGKKGVWNPAYCVPCEYDELFGQGSDLYLARNGEKYGLIRKNEVIIPCEYDDLKIDEVGGHKMIQARKKEKIGLLDIMGSIKVPMQYKSLNYIKYGNRSVIVAELGNNKVGVIGLDGEILVPFDYAGLSLKTESDRTFFIAKKRNKYGIVVLNEVGQAFNKECIIVECKYKTEEEAIDVEHNLAASRKLDNNTNKESKQNNKNKPTRVKTMPNSQRQYIPYPYSNILRNGSGRSGVQQKNSRR